MAEVRLTVIGEVQGVGFRAFVQRHALALGLTGYARNMSDGSVEVLAQGPTASLRQLVAKVRSGPRRAVVEKVTEQWSDAKTASYSGFRIR